MFAHDHAGHTHHINKHCDESAIFNVITLNKHWWYGDKEALRISQRCLHLPLANIKKIRCNIQIVSDFVIFV